VDLDWGGIGISWVKLGMHTISLGVGRALVYLGVNQSDATPPPVIRSRWVDTCKLVTSAVILNMRYIEGRAPSPISLEQVHPSTSPALLTAGKRMEERRKRLS
jgi:hypothetical protein